MALMAVACGSARKKKGKKKRAPTGGHLVADRERGKGKRQMLFRNVMSLIWYRNGLKRPLLDQMSLLISSRLHGDNENKTDLQTDMLSDA